MSATVGRGPRGRDHARARELAALRLDEPLVAADAAWLDAHLVACEGCRTVAAEYEDGRNLLRAARATAPVPPRDLWARTAAAIEAERGVRSPAGVRRLVGFGRFAAAPVAALVVVALVVGTGMLNGTFVPSGSPQPTAMLVSVGELRVLTTGLDGSLSMSTRRYDQVCPLGVAACSGTTAEAGSTTITQLADLGAIDAYMSPSHDHIVVLQKGSGSGGVFVVPVGPSTANAAPSPSPSVAPGSGDPATSAPASTATAPPGPDGPGSPKPSTGPVASPSPVVSAPPSGDASPSPTVAVSPAPDGTIQIARDVIVVGSLSAYSPDGTRFAFTARVADGSAGPDIYVWRTGDALAIPVTTDHASLFAAWVGDRLLVTRVVAGVAATVLLDPATGVGQAVASGAAWRPAPGPGATTAVWWDGTLSPTADGFGWVPGTGRLVLGAWPGAAASLGPSAAPSGSASASVGASTATASGSAEASGPPSLSAGSSPSASPDLSSAAAPSISASPDGSGAATASGSLVPSASPNPSIVPPSGAFELQVLASGPIRDWQVRWDDGGTALAVWTTTGAAGTPGRLSLYAVDPVTGAANLATPLIDGAAAFEGFSLEAGRLTWSAPTASGGATVDVLAWSGSAIGRLEVPMGRGTTLVR